MIFIFGSGLAFFLGILLLGKKGKSKSDKILTVWMFFISLHLFLFSLYNNEDYLFKYARYISFGIPFPLIHGPFLYLYTASLTRHLSQKKHVKYFHFLPAITDYLLLAIFLFPLPLERIVELFINYGQGFEVYNNIHSIVILISGIGYIIGSQILLTKHKKKIRNEFSNIDGINLNWLRVLIYGLTAIYITVLLNEVSFKFGFRSEILIYIVAVVFIAVLGYFGIKQTSVFVDQSRSFQNNPEDIKNKIPAPHVKSEQKKENEAVVRYAKSGLNKDKAQKLKTEIEKAMEVEKLYTNSDLSLNELANKFSIHSNYLSQVINEQFDKNFYDFINTYRLEEFKGMMANPRSKNFTLLSLALDSGFSSKSSFNRYFKKSTGKTPSQYADSLKNQ